MADSSRTEKPTIVDVRPRETKGRDTIARFHSQFRAAAFECLSILSGDGIDRVYCDYQDDFVTRNTKAGTPIYHFFQVKTKEKSNHQWNKLEIFGLKKRGKPEASRIGDSFAGRLLLHTVRFKQSCGSVIFLTNVELDNDVESIAAAIEQRAFSNSDLRSIIQQFNDAFTNGEPLDDQAIEQNIAKLGIRPGIHHLDPYGDSFQSTARDAIHQYSEIDLSYRESEEIISNLLTLVQKKSFNKLLNDLTEDQLDDLAGIGITDLLEILSISKGAYQLLLDGGDPTAIKSASIIQRKLRGADAPNDIIEYCSRWKVQWDTWLRDKRHTVPEFDLNNLLDQLHSIKNGWARQQHAFAELKGPIDALWASIQDTSMAKTMQKDLLVGGVLSALVRSESQ